MFLTLPVKTRNSACFLAKCDGFHTVGACAYATIQTDVALPLLPCSKQRSLRRCWLLLSHRRRETMYGPVSLFLFDFFDFEEAHIWAAVARAGGADANTDTDTDAGGVFVERRKQHARRRRWPCGDHDANRRQRLCQPHSDGQRTGNESDRDALGFQWDANALATDGLRRRR